jgi:hypothetical protein
LRARNSPTPSSRWDPCSPTEPDRNGRARPAAPRSRVLHPRRRRPATARKPGRNRRSVAHSGRLCGRPADPNIKRIRTRPRLGPRTHDTRARARIFAKRADEGSTIPPRKMNTALWGASRGSVVKPFADAAFALKPVTSEPSSKRPSAHVIKRTE